MSPCLRRLLGAGLILALVGCSNADREEAARLRSELESVKAERDRLKRELAERNGDPAASGHNATGTISGKVVYKGAPITGGIVAFHSGGKVFAASIGADGTYQVPKIPPGDTKVTVDTSSARPIRRPPGGMKPQSGGKIPPEMKMPPPGGGGTYVPIPPKYADPHTTPLTYTVKRGRQEFDVQLTD